MTTVHTIYALPAARYKAWIHRCAYIAVQVHTLHKARRYNPWGSIVCTVRSMDCVNPIDCARQSTDCPDPYFAHNTHACTRSKLERSCQLHPSLRKTVKPQWQLRSSLEQGTGMAGQRSVGTRGLKQMLSTSARGERGREPSP